MPGGFFDKSNSFLALSGGILTGTLTVPSPFIITPNTGQIQFGTASTDPIILGTTITNARGFQFQLLAGGFANINLGRMYAVGMFLANNTQLMFSSTTSNQGAVDAGISRGTAPNTVTGTNGTVGSAGDFQAAASLLTVGTMTATNSSLLREGWHRFDWTNAMVVALGAGLTGDIAVCTLPAKTVVVNAYAVITGTAAGPTTLTVAVGRTSAAYIDYIVASDAKVAANTVYGDASGERGTNLVGYDLPSFTGTTVVNAHFIATVTNLNTTTGSTGSVYLQTATLP